MADQPNLSGFDFQPTGSPNSDSTAQPNLNGFDFQPTGGTTPSGPPPVPKPNNPITGQQDSLLGLVSQGRFAAAGQHIAGDVQDAAQNSYPARVVRYMVEKHSGQPTTERPEDIANDAVRDFAFSLSGAEAPEAKAPEVEGAAQGITEDSVPKASLTDKVLKGTETTQGADRQAVINLVNDISDKAGVARPVVTDKTPLSELLDKPISDMDAAEKAKYANLKGLAQDDLKTLYDKREDLTHRIDNNEYAGTSHGEANAQAKLQTIQDSIDRAEANVRGATNGGDAQKMLDEARGMTQQRYAAKEVRRQILNGGSIEGNPAIDEAETVNHSGMLNTIRQMRQGSNYADKGRLVQAAGQAGADRFEKNMFINRRAAQSATAAQEATESVPGGKTLMKLKKSKDLASKAIQ